LYLHPCTPCSDPSESGEAYLAVFTRAATLLKSRERSNAAQVGYSHAVMHDGGFCAVRSTNEMPLYAGSRGCLLL
jgi:hypothetical protein